MPIYPINPDPQFTPNGFGAGSSQTGIDSRIPKFFGYRCLQDHTAVEIAADGYFGPALPWSFLGPNMVGNTSPNENAAQPTLAKSVPPGSFISIVAFPAPVPPDQQFQAAVVTEIEPDASVPAAYQSAVKPTKVIANHWVWPF